MTVTAVVERTRESKQLTDKELLQIFCECQRKYSSDLGLIVVGLHLENLARIEDIEQRLAKLEAKKR